MLRLLSRTIYHAISDAEGKSIKKDDRGRNRCAHCVALTYSCQMPFSNSWELWISLRLVEENAYAHLTTYGERAMRADREMEGAMESIGGVVGEGGGVKWKCRRGTMELYKSKQVHLITGFWQKQGWEKVVGRGRQCGGEEV